MAVVQVSDGCVCASLSSAPKCYDGEKMRCSRNFRDDYPCSGCRDYHERYTMSKQCEGRIANLMQGCIHDLVYEGGDFH